MSDLLKERGISFEHIDRTPAGSLTSYEVLINGVVKGAVHRRWTPEGNVAWFYGPDIHAPTRAEAACKLWESTR